MCHQKYPWCFSAMECQILTADLHINGPTFPPLIVGRHQEGKALPVSFLEEGLVMVNAVHKQQNRSHQMQPHKLRWDKEHWVKPWELWISSRSCESHHRTLTQNWTVSSKNQGSNMSFLLESTPYCKMCLTSRRGTTATAILWITGVRTLPSLSITMNYLRIIKLVEFGGVGSRTRGSPWPRLEEAALAEMEN